MRTHLRRRWPAPALVLLALAAMAPAAHAVPFNARGLYNCSTYSAITHTYTYWGSFQFKSGGRYAEGFIKGSASAGYHLAGHIVSGRYRRSGKRITGVSGYLKRRHQSLLIQPADLALQDSRHRFLGVGCYLYRKTPPPTGPRVTGDYNCYRTTEDPSGGFESAFAGELTLWSDGTYLTSGGIRQSGWTQSGNAIRFTGGSLWTTHAHDAATFHPGGVAMPHATGSFAGVLFHLVIRDTMREGGLPPSREFVTDDDPGNPRSVPSSFNYCNPKG